MSMPLSLPPGFRFNPTDEELVFYYLRNRAASRQCPAPVVADVDVYKFDHIHGISHAVYGDIEWYFFSPRDRKYPNGMRPNRSAGSGYWKATGAEKTIHDGATGEGIGFKKTLAFYKGRTPKGTKTSWTMHEYRLVNANKPIKFGDVSTRLDDWVLCRIYKKMGQVLPMVPPVTLADYDHTWSATTTYRAAGGGFFASSSSNSTCRTMIVPQPGSAAITGRLPTIPFIPELFDERVVPQIFHAEAEHLAIHRSLNQLLSGIDSTQVVPSYDAKSSSPAAGEGAGKHKAVSLEDFGGARDRIVVCRPPIVVQEDQRVVPRRGAAAVVAERLSSGGIDRCYVGSTIRCFLVHACAST